ncbi:nucleotidyltransferase family protein [Geminocystis sp.]|uniref:nucleotidyltransferase family protein n=1 Tax=Geminocystis sp. TaxID=2664100 RepID=UPI003592F77E
MITNYKLENLKQKIDSSLEISEDIIIKFCQRFKIQQLAVFGSILRDDFNVDSDIDFLITLSSDVKLNLTFFQLMETDLKNLVNRDIDIIFKDNLKRSSNWIRKKEILTTAEVIYEA